LGVRCGIRSLKVYGRIYEVDEMDQRPQEYVVSGQGVCQIDLARF
jgi:hypothetical protein